MNKLRNQRRFSSEEAKLMKSRELGTGWTSYQSQLLPLARLAVSYSISLRLRGLFEKWGK